MTNNQEIQSIKNRFGIIGNAPALNYAISVAAQVATTDLTSAVKVEVEKNLFQKSFITSALENMANSSPSTAVQFQKEPLILNCLDMKKALLQAP